MSQKRTPKFAIDEPVLVRSKTSKGWPEGPGCVWDRRHLTVLPSADGGCDDCEAA